MKFKKLLTAFMTAAIISGSITPTVFAADFSDINDVPWEGAKTYINAVADSGLMVGDYNAKGKKVFRARDKVSYCETMQLVYTLMKEYTGKGVDPAVVTKYTSVMSGYKIPSWAYDAVAYGLENSIVTINDIPGFITSKGTNANATRQDVAIMLGRALKVLESVNNDAKLSFKDASSAASVAVPYIDLLNRLGIITGDSDGNFNPKNHINRAETAVIVSKTHELIKSKKNSNNNSSNNNSSNNNSSNNNNGNSSSVIKPMETKSSTGTVTGVATVNGSVTLNINTGSETLSFTAVDSKICLKGTNVVALSSITVGDKVLISYTGPNIQSVVITTSSSSGNSNNNSSSSSYKNTSLKGTFTSVTRSELVMRKSGEKITLPFDDTDYVRFYYDSESYKYSEFKDKVSSGDSVTVYTDGNGYVTRINAEEGSDTEYDVTGYLDKLSSSYIRIAKTKNGSSTEYAYKNDSKSNVAFYIGTSEKDYDDFYDKVGSNSKIGIVTNSSDKVIEVHLLDSSSSDDYDKEGYIYKVADEYIRIVTSKNSSDYKEYTYVDKDYDSVKFYVDGSKKSYSKFNDAVSKGYSVGLVLDKNDKVTKVYAKKSSSSSSSTDYDKKGYVYKVKDDSIRIVTSKNSSDYKEYTYKNEDSNSVDFYVDKKSKSFDKFKDAAEKGTSVGIVLNSSDKVTAVYLTTDDDDDDDDDYDKEGYIYRLKDSYIRITSSKSSSDYKEYSFKNDSSDDVTFYVDGSEKTYSKFNNTAEEGDKVGLMLNSSGYVTKVYLISGSSSSSSGKTAEGDISSISSSKVKISGNGSNYIVDKASKINVDVTDGKSNIDNYDDLEEAINDDNKTATVKLKYDSDNYITSITGYISGGSGLLSSIDTSGKTIKIEFDDDKTTYKYKSSMSVDLRYYDSSVSGLEKAIDGESKSDRTVKIKVNSDGYITEISSKSI